MLARYRCGISWSFASEDRFVQRFFQSRREAQDQGSVSKETEDIHGHGCVVVPLSLVLELL